MLDPVTPGGREEHGRTIGTHVHSVRASIPEKSSGI